MIDWLDAYFRNLLAETLTSAIIMCIAVIIILIVLSIIFFWAEWKDRENLDYKWETLYDTKLFY